MKEIAEEPNVDRKIDEDEAWDRIEIQQREGKRREERERDGGGKRTKRNLRGKVRVTVGFTAETKGFSYPWQMVTITKSLHQTTTNVNRYLIPFPALKIFIPNISLGESNRTTYWIVNVEHSIHCSKYINSYDSPHLSRSYIAIN